MIKKTVIANKGISHKGKSSTLKLISQVLLNQFPNATTTPTDIDYSGDVKVIITIDKIKIGIESQGDPGGRLGKSLDEFAAIPCDIIVCATRTSGQGVWDVEEMKPQYGYDIIWVANHRSDEKNHDALNQLSAEQIVELIKRLIAEEI